VDNVLIRGTETRAHPDKHVVRRPVHSIIVKITKQQQQQKKKVYAIEVATKSRVWTVFRRYNEFVTLHETVCSCHIECVQQLSQHRND